VECVLILWGMTCHRYWCLSHRAMIPGKDLGQAVFCRCIMDAVMVFIAHNLTRARDLVRMLLMVGSDTSA